MLWCGLNWFLNLNILDCFFHMRTKWDEQKYWVKHDKSLLTNLKIAADKMWAKSVTHRLQLGREWVYLRQTGLLSTCYLLSGWLESFLQQTTDRHDNTWHILHMEYCSLLIAHCRLSSHSDSAHVQIENKHSHDWLFGLKLHIGHIGTLVLIAEIKVLCSTKNT